MPENRIHRTLTLRTAVRASEFTGDGDNLIPLELVLHNIHEKLVTIGERRADFDGKIIDGRNIRIRQNEPILLHLVAYTPDDKTSVVPSDDNKKSAALALLDAPNNAEFLDGELMILVNGNDVAICRSGLTERAFISYVAQLAAACEIDTSAAAFHLMKRADVDKLEMIRRDGIKRVSMNSVAYQASVDHAERRSVSRRILGGALDDFHSLLGIEGETPAGAENIKMEISFKFDKRRGTTLDQHQLAVIAEKILSEEEDEGFVIETLSGRMIRANEIVLSKPTSFRAYGKSISHMEAWAALREFYSELELTP